MKVSIITLHAVVNYGSALQTYATQHIFRQLGTEPEIVDYRRKAVLPRTLWQILTDPEYSLLMKLKLTLIRPSSKLGRKVFDEFLERSIHMTDQRYTYAEDFTKFPIQADVYCTGSDQVWNTGWHHEIPAPYFLSYAPEDKKKIAFSASFGKDHLDDWEKPGIRDYLKQYAAISVRENSAVGIVRDLGEELQAEHVLDPTLTAEPSVWQELAAPERLVKEKYILVYQLNNNKQFERYAKQLAKEKNLKLIRLCTRYDQKRKPGHGIVLPKVEEYLSLIRDAEYVVTDSFHGTAFCLIFHKQFVDIYPGLYNSRLESILGLTHLESRHLEDFSDFAKVAEPIDYAAVDRILERERAHTMQFLEDALRP